MIVSLFKVGYAELIKSFYILMCQSEDSNRSSFSFTFYTILQQQQYTIEGNLGYSIQDYKKMKKCVSIWIKPNVFSTSYTTYIKRYHYTFCSKTDEV